MRKKIILLLLLLPLININCTDEEFKKMIIETELNSVTHNTATFKISTLNPDNLLITSHGVCWSEQKNPNLSDSYIEIFSNKEQTECTVTDLIPEMQYFARAYMVSEAGTSFTEEISFKTNLSGLPTIETKIASEISATSAQIEAKIIDNGNTPTLETGICFSTEPSPTVECQKIILSSNPSIINIQLENLARNTLYYVRPYASNINGVGYGNEIKVKTSYGTMKDVEGNIYQTVKIGDQIWMRENLKTARYADGRPIPDGTGLGMLPAHQKAQFIFEDNPYYLEPFGRLYNWYAVMDGEKSSDKNPSGIQGCCPDGWHVPSDAEWIEMEKFLGIEKKDLYLFGDRGTDQGRELQPGGSTGFDALLAGVRAGAGYFVGVPNNGYFYCSTETMYGRSLLRRVHAGTGYFERNDRANGNAYSVRCVQD